MNNQVIATELLKVAESLIADADKVGLDFAKRHGERVARVSGKRVEKLNNKQKGDHTGGISRGTIVGRNGPHLLTVKWDNGMKSDIGRSLVQNEGYYEDWFPNNYDDLLNAGNRRRASR
tara:strand:+ start:919 stop:1275 length:357 start_codon:yes stop_codon:yes gene_type:complete